MHESGHGPWYGSISPKYGNAKVSRPPATTITTTTTAAATASTTTTVFPTAKYGTRT